FVAFTFPTRRSSELFGRNFDAALSWPAKFGGIGIAVYGDSLDTRARNIERSVLYPVNYDLSSLRIIGSAVHKEGGNRQGILVFRWQAPQEVSVQINRTRILFRRYGIVGPSRHSNL